MAGKNPNILWLLLILPLCLTGCGGRLPDISSRAIVSAVAVDAGEEGVDVTAEYLEKVGADEVQRYGVARARGRTFAEAVTVMERDIGHTLYLDSCRVLLVGGVGRREDLLGLLTELDSDRRIRPLTLVAVSTGDAGDLVKEKEGEETSVGQEFQELLGNTPSARFTVKDCINLLRTTGRGMLLPLVEHTDRYAIAGYTPLDGTGLCWDASAAGLIPMMGHDSAPITVVGEDGTFYDLLLERKSLRVTCGVRDGAPVFHLKILLSANLISAGATGRGGDEVTALAEQALEQRAWDDYRFVIDHFVREGGVDLLSLGKRFSLKYPEEWNKYEKNWQWYIKNIECEILTIAEIKDQRGAVD